MALTTEIATPASSLHVDPLGDDGGYLVALVTACRVRLPAGRRSRSFNDRQRSRGTRRVVLATGYYAASAAHGSLAAQLAPSLLAALGPPATPIVLALRAQHRLGSARGG